MDEVIVVGAGPVGLALAVWLRRFDVPVRVLEARGAPRPEARASHVHGGVLEAMLPLGVVDALMARGRPSSGAELVARHATLATVDLSTLPSRFPLTLSIPQPEVESVLADRLRALGTRVERPAVVRSVDVDGAGVTLHVERDGHRERARATWVIGCDGASSIVREAMGVSSLGLTSRRTMALADVRGVGPPLERARLHLDGPLVARLPLRDGERWVADGVSEDAVVDTVRSRLDLARPDEVVWRLQFRLHARVTSTLRQGRVLLAGDAAHLHSPLGGHGMNTGLLDAMDLGWKLALVVKRLASPGLLDSYTDDRLPAIRRSVASAWLATLSVRLPPPLSWLRNLGMSATSDWRPVRRRLASWSAETDVHCVRSPWVHDVWPGHDARAGTRAPDLQRGQGWLLDPIRGPHVGILVREANVDTVRAEARARLGEHVRVVACDPDAPDLADATGSAPVVAVRPDGLVGFRGPAEALPEWLDHLVSGIA